MALDVYLQPTDEPPIFQGGAHRYVCALDDNGYYWYLDPLVEALTAQTGQSIDLYGGATFVGATLAALNETLTVATACAYEQPDTWDVQVGTSLGSARAPEHRDLYDTVDKQHLLTLLDTLHAAVMQAQAGALRLVFVGD